MASCCLGEFRVWGLGWNPDDMGQVQTTAPDLTSNGGLSNNSSRIDLVSGFESLSMNWPGLTGGHVLRTRRTS